MNMNNSSKGNSPFMGKITDYSNSNSSTYKRGNSGYKIENSYSNLYNDNNKKNYGDYNNSFKSYHNNSDNVKNLISGSGTLSNQTLNGGGNCIPNKETRTEKGLNKIAKEIIKPDQTQNRFNQKPNSRTNQKRETDFKDKDNNKGYNQTPTTLVQPKNDFDKKNFLGDNLEDLIKGLDGDKNDRFNRNQISNSTSINNSDIKSKKENNEIGLSGGKREYNNSYIEKETSKDMSITQKYVLNKSEINNGKMLVGFRNLGNTCYMNTSLQLLLNCDEFIEQLIKSGVKKNKTGVTQEFIALCNEYKKQSISSSYHKEISPSDFKRSFGKAHRKFEGYQQQDSQEFLRNLLDDISNETNRSSNTKYKEIDDVGKNKKQIKEEYDKFYLSREDSVVTEFFNGEFITTFACSNCGNESYSFQKFIDIPIYLSKIF